ncbi:MAG: hypothetical protein WD025_08290 [Bacteriovoracaceae bacterium]
MELDQPQFIDNLERVKACLRIEDEMWLDFLQMSKLDYLRFKSGAKPLPEDKLAAVAGLAGVSEEAILSNQINFRALRPLRASNIEVPPRYQKAAYGRWRSSSFSLDFIEAKYGWKARLGCMRNFGLEESLVNNPFGRVSMQFITDLCDYLHRCQYSDKDIYDMGSYTHIANRSTLIGQAYSQAESPKKVYEMFLNSVELYEKNCLYEFVRVTDSDCAIKARSIKDVAEEMGAPHLGSARVCKWKEGFFASLVSYLDLPWPEVRETSCVHRGDEFCLFEIDYGYAQVVSKLRQDH